ncbi:MAG: hypothetical protein ACM3UR_01040 [Bacteroidota bacterium]|jgi:hypothetical protein|nr:hypothetical protein [Ignavibacteria bacterium]MCU7498585.1 hypothetical protein [Ignavibacteria bacterium]MCU7514671.1 hypothetical protein [Ignavibacteria bacterium]MCU7520892.1 hypothetical protein [Ignavibacteria bacterium]MCU7523570.1 hypothetical protein [Ignavibacteria bacterium]
MYRLSILLTLALSSVIILSGCSKSTEPQNPKPDYFTSTGIAYPNWHDTGSPEGIMPELSLVKKMDFKARTYYYNILPSDVLLNTILNQVPDGYSGDENVLVLDVVYDPSLKGTYNYTPDLSDPTKCWGGLQRLVGEDELKGDVNSYQVQVWMNVQQAPKGAKLYIDLGRISEDVIPNYVLSTEDKNGNLLLEPGEDTGLDGLADQQEPFYNALTNPDPSGDNYSYSPGSADYTHFNGNENNALSSENGKVPETEDIDNNGNLDRRNGFFRYEIPLDSLDADKRFIVEKGKNGWVNVRIPVSAFTNTIGQPALSAPIIMRLWFSGVQSTIRLRFAELRLISK